MRVAHFLPFACLLFFGAFTSACTTHQFASGSASYTSTPQLSDHSGALPLSPLVCLKGRDGLRPNAGIDLGGSCVLTGIYEPHRSRHSPSGGEGNLHASGSCAVPTLAGPVPLGVQNATLQVSGNAVNLTVGGATNDGRYLTYRFTGMLAQDASSETCDRMFESGRAR